MAIGKTPQDARLGFIAGNDTAAGLDFDGIVAGLEETKIGKKRINREYCNMVRKFEINASSAVYCIN
jgi:methionine salvage enolase-phosphatase E1